MGPPKKYKDAKIERAGVFKCDVSGNAFIGFLWLLPGGGQVFEHAHGPVGTTRDLTTVLDLIRTERTVYGKLAINMWNVYFNTHKHGDKLWTKNWVIQG